MKKKTYEALRDVQIVNLSNEPVGTLKKGDSVYGELILIEVEPGKEVPYIETEDKTYIPYEGLAEAIDQTDVTTTEAKVKSSHIKFIVALICGGIAFGIAHKMGKGTKAKILFTLGGVVTGFLGEFIYSKYIKK